MERSEQELWEDKQANNVKLISMTKGKERKASNKKYVFVFEDQIDFVMQDAKKKLRQPSEVKTSQLMKKF